MVAQRLTHITPPAAAPDQLYQRVEAACSAVPQEFIQSLFESMPRRVIFFVLRKKNKHISTLHVVHHAVVPIAVWGGFRVEPGNYNYFFPLINTIVHTVMYSYYGLAALGPSVQKYLWWKKYLTTFQMIQFVMVFFYVLTLMVGNCKVSKFIIYLNTFLAGLFLLMFYDYFQNTYLRKRAIKKQKDLDDKEQTNREKNGNVPQQNGHIKSEKKDH
ncbi:UNVERIFIED_CONTAM: Elongation of very long chain fatty acids protein [Trichonephila clavipes]